MSNIADFDVHHDTVDASRESAAKSAIQGALSSVDGDDALATAALAEAVGLGPFDAILTDANIGEAVVHGGGVVFVDRGEGLRASGASVSSSAAASTIAKRIANLAGRALPANGIYENTLPSGHAVTIYGADVAPGGPIVQLRHAGERDLAASGVVDSGVLELLTRAITARKNIVVMGPANAGVSGVVGALARIAGSGSVIVESQSTIDAPAAARLTANGVSLSELVSRASQMNADRLVVDGVGGADTADVLSSLTARDGCIVGIKARGDALTALANLTSIGVANPAATTGLITAAVHVVVQVERRAEGSRVTSVVEVTGPGTTSSLASYDGTSFAMSGTPTF